LAHPLKRYRCARIGAPRGTTPWQGRRRRATTPSLDPGWFAARRRFRRSSPSRNPARRGIGKLTPARVAVFHSRLRTTREGGVPEETEGVIFRLARLTPRRHNGCQTTPPSFPSTCSTFDGERYCPRCRSSRTGKRPSPYLKIRIGQRGALASEPFRDASIRPNQAGNPCDEDRAEQPS
jgi:hypothetical protein